MCAAFILSGHQASVYHPGILAKRIELHKRARATGAQAQWLLADQDLNDAEVIRYPDIDTNGRLCIRRWRLCAADARVPTCARPMNVVEQAPRVSSALPGSIQQGLNAIEQAVADAPGTTVATRISAANEALLDMLPAVELIRASAMIDSSVARPLLERIADDPISCAQAWNRALLAAPRAARALRIAEGDPQRTEVPLWSLDQNNQRQRATAADLHEFLAGGAPLLPRAFLMTALARSTTEAPMIHGTGAEQYEVVTSLWAASFLELQLPPVVIATATERLPLTSFTGADSTRQARQVTNELRALQHNPWLEPATKDRLLGTIEAAPRLSRTREAAFRTMHAEREAQIKKRSDEIRQLQHDEVVSRDAQRASAVATERTWPWRLYSDVLVARLRVEVSSKG